MSFYLDFLPQMVGADGVIRGPAGDGRVAAVLRDDVAAACAAVLTGKGQDGKVYELTGPESSSFAEISYLAIPEGTFARVSGDVQALTGRRPTSLAEDLAAHPGRLDHVAG